jgi:hypothetical protein
LSAQRPRRRLSQNKKQSDQQFLSQVPIASVSSHRPNALSVALAVPFS